MPLSQLAAIEANESTEEVIGEYSEAQRIIGERVYQQAHYGEASISIKAYMGGC